MPELPEVETVRYELAEKIIGLKIRKITVNQIKMLKNISPAKFTSRLEGKTIKDVLRKGKYIIVDLVPKLQLVIHLGMTGILIHPHIENTIKNVRYSIKSKHNHLIFVFTDNSRMVFNDVRRFGKVFLVRHLTEIDSIKNLGLEPLDGEFTPESLFNIIEMNPKKRIKSLMMNQQLIAGLGNIYANEVLYRAGIHPMRLASSLAENDAVILCKQIKHVLDRAIQLKGSTISDGAFRDTDGKQGKFRQEIMVYARKGEKCLKCHNQIEMVKIDGRSSFYCPGCQKL